jgi:hypothetical protein
LLLGFFNGPVRLPAQDSTQPSGRIRYHFLPSLYYLPETKTAFGGVLYAVIHSPDSNQKKGNLQHYFTITQNRQLLFENSWQYFGPGNGYLLQGKLDLSRFPELFFGIGQPKPGCEPVLYASNQLNLQSQFLKQLVPNLYTGISLSLNHLSKPDLSRNPSANPEKLLQATGGNGFWAGTLGVSLVYDTRDLALNAFRGMYLDLSFQQGKCLNGSDFRYLSMDLRRYLHIQKWRGTFAVQLMHRASFGGIPFRLMPSLGGPSLLRGYYAGQLRDNRMVFFQAEWRQHLKGRFGLVLFSGGGNVANAYKELTDEWHQQWGLGLRFRIRKDDRVNLRVDYAYTGQFSNFYVVLAEAF